MIKSVKILKESDTTILKIGQSYYIRIPVEFIQDSAFPLLILRNIINKLRAGVTVKIKMLKDKLIVEEK